jgi:hypothetical protein
MESQAEARYYVVVEPARGPLQILSCDNQEALGECVHKLRAEVCERRRLREDADTRIYTFYGIRYHLQKWPFAALVHGQDIIPLDPLNDLEPVIDESGALYEEPSLINRSPRRDLRSPSVPAETLAEAVPGNAFSPEDDDSADEEEGLPPGQNPEIIG